MRGLPPGHSHIDFLRLDVEGWEWETFRAVIRDFTLERVAPPPAGGAGGGAGGVKDVGVGAGGMRERERSVLNRRPDSEGRRELRDKGECGPLSMLLEDFPSRFRRDVLKLKTENETPEGSQQWGSHSPYADPI